MGSAKRLLEDHEARLDIAMQIAIDAGALQRCAMHEECVFEGRELLEEAYKLGNFRFSKGDYVGAFESRREMTDAIKSVFDDHCADTCPRCDAQRDDD